MRRTNIYLSDDQLDVLRRLGEQRGQPVSELVREALDVWLQVQGVQVLSEDEWEQRFQSLLSRRQAIAEELTPSMEHVEGDVAAAIRQVRRPGAARRH